MIMEQIVRGDTCSPGPPETSHPVILHKHLCLNATAGVPREVGTENKTQVELSDTLKQIQTLMKALLKRIDALIPVRYLVLDGYFGHNNALQMNETMWVGAYLKVARQYRPLFSIHDALRRTWTPASLRAAFQSTTH